MENFVLIGVFVLLGMLFSRLKAFPKDSAQVLNMFALYVSLPARYWTYPEKLAQGLQNVALTLVPVVMTAIGLQLRLRLPRRVMAPLGFGLGVKLLVAPLSALLACRLAGFSGMVVDVSILEAGMPPMVTAGALAVMAGMEADLAVAMVGIGIVLSFATLPALFGLTKVF